MAQTKWHQREHRGHPTGLWAALMAALLVAIMELPVAAADGKRVAFVVGIGTYDNLPHQQLKNAVNDADGVSKKLDDIGFNVVKAINPTRPAFNAEWQKVLDSLGKDDTFVLYFSAHGVQVEGQNYLLPRDIPYIQFGRQAQLTREAISLNELLSDLTTGNRTHPRSSVVILDACRDNPLIPPEYKGPLSGGLANQSRSDGIFMIFSAASNSIALDRLSPNDSVKYSVFTRALLPLLGRQDLSIQDMSLELKKEVWRLAKSVNRYQRPDYFDGFDPEERFCFPGCAAKTNKDTAGLTENLVVSVLPATKNEITGRDDAPMVLIPAGEFWMGSPNGVGAPDEHPRHRVYLDAYYMDRFEVTVSRYTEFMQSTGRQDPRYWNQVKTGKHSDLPVIGVDWHDAEAYCRWVGKRLPTEAEWEKAARGTDGRTYPWGNNKPTTRVGNFMKKTLANAYDERLAPAESYEEGQSPYGLHHMAGNVWEWTVDWYDEHFYAASPQRNPTGPLTGTYKVIRGGSWDDEPVDVRSAYRGKYQPMERYDNIGFRCAQDRPK